MQVHVANASDLLRLYGPAGLSEIMKHHIYVGMADHTLALLQHGTKLYLANAQLLTHDMFYQQVRVPMQACCSICICRRAGLPQCCMPPAGCGRGRPCSSPLLV